MNPELEAARNALAALPDDAAHSLDPEPEPPPHDLPPGAPPPPPFVLPEHLAGKPDAALRQAQDAALAAGLSPGQANAAGRAAAEYVLAHGTSPETFHKRELLRDTEAGLSPDEVVRLAREAGDRAAAAREAARVPQAAAAAAPAAPTPGPAPPFVLPLPEVPATAPGAGEGAGLNPVPASGPAPGFELPPPTTQGLPGPGGTTPPWWDPFLGDVVGAEPESPTPRWWDPMLGEVVEPGAGRRPEPPDAGGEETYARPPTDESEAPFGGLLEPLARLPAAAGRAFGSLLGRGGAAGRDVAELLGVGGEGGAGGEEEVPFAPLTTPPGAGFGEGGGGVGDLVGLLTRIAEGVERLIEAVGQAQEAGGASFGGRPGRPTPGDDFGYDDDPETPASPSVDLWDLLRPGKTQDAASRPEPEAPKRQRRAAPEES